VPLGDDTPDVTREAYPHKPMPGTIREAADHPACGGETLQTRETDGILKALHPPLFRQSFHPFAGL
jgi:hypothetical protein